MTRNNIIGKSRIKKSAYGYGKSPEEKERQRKMRHRVNGRRRDTGPLKMSSLEKFRRGFLHGSCVSDTPLVTYTDEIFDRSLLEANQCPS